MEAVAVHNFDATKSDELSFRRDDVLKVVNNVDDPNWYLAQLGPHQGLVPWNYLRKDWLPAWYHGTISRQHSEMLLANQPIGSFLVRTSEYSHSNFSLSLKCAQAVQHFRVLHEPIGKYHLWNVRFDSINQLIDYYRSVSISQSQQILLKDMNRHFQVQALYDFTPKEAGELEFKRGDIITVLNNDDPNWWEGQIEQRRGQFPVNYVKIHST